MKEGLPGGDRGVEWSVGGASRPHMSASRPSLWCGVFLSLLEPSRVVYAVDKHNLI